MALIVERSLKKEFPDLQVNELVLEGLRIRDRDLGLQSAKGNIQAEVREMFTSLEEIRENKEFRAYRDFFWKVGIDPTKTRPSAEALVRRIFGGRDLPTINTLVDSYNLASVYKRISIAAFDMDFISEEGLLMRRATKGENFHGIGMDSNVSLKGMEVVIEDQGTSDIIAVYPYRDASESRVTLDSERVLFMMCGVPGISNKLLDEARDFTEEMVEQFCRGKEE